MLCCLACFCCGTFAQTGPVTTTFPWIPETIVAKTAKTFGLMSMKDAAGHIKTKAELKASKPMWDENWGIRRSERIFLNDPGPLSPGGEAKETQSKLPPSKLPVSAALFVDTYHFLLCLSKKECFQERFFLLQALKDPTPLLKAASTALALKTKASVKDRSKIRPQDMSEKVQYNFVKSSQPKASEFKVLRPRYSYCGGSMQALLFVCGCAWGGGVVPAVGTWWCQTPVSCKFAKLAW